MGHVERKQREKEAVKKKILDAAIKIAAKEGWHSVTIRRIADAIEYTPPIVYEHFENKDDLITGIKSVGFKMLYESFVKENMKEIDPKEKLIAISLAYWDFAFNNEELFKVMFSIERHVKNDEAIATFSIVRDVFYNLTKIEDEAELKKLIFNWMCLMMGTIGAIVHFSKVENPHKIEDPKKLFMDFIERFIKSLS